MPSCIVSTEYLELAVVLEPMLPTIPSHGDTKPSGRDLASSNLTLTFPTPSLVVRFITRPDIAHPVFAADCAKDLNVKQRGRTKIRAAPTAAVRLIDIVNDSPSTLMTTKWHST